nr:immunoglobulin light chain junction region [Macaca mulatta]
DYYCATLHSSACWVF